MSSGTKSKSKSVSLDPELWERVEAKAKVEHGGNRSAYLRDLALADLSGNISPANSMVLGDLAKVFTPTIAESLRKKAEGKDQPRIVARFLEALLDGLSRHDFNPEKPFLLFNDVAQLEATIGAPNFVNRLVDEILSRSGGTSLSLVAEDQTAYQKPETKIKDKLKTGQAAPIRDERK